ncbi:DNA polymerase-4 [Haloactinopolyspora alba]|uniref:DNA polymerase IV n=1 Tax=Haloactinopolyspora alba TaxID=648780 RepID=A0A2P8E2H4_9ACTN|nr:DNA polymerase IV [Haloactinopolyspora alba]PSL03668.1 DNA polymerase-4 [Haloactinopolyspora alba]
MRVLHLDLDAFFASVEQRDKPSLRGRPVIVGGIGPRGVVSTASYEARTFGVRSAMSMSEARARCPHAAYLAGRFAVYREVSEFVMDQLRAISPLLEPLSLDEAFVDLGGSDLPDLSPGPVRKLADDLRATIRARTGVTASVGVASSKLMAKIASEQAKPDGMVVIEPGAELDVLHPLSVRALPGVGPATAARLARLGVKTVGDLARITEPDLVDLVGAAHGGMLHRLARARDERAVSTERESKSISVEDTFDRDVTDPTLLAALVTRLAEKLAERMNASGHSGRTITLKTRLHDFTTLSRSATLPAPTDDPRTVSRVASRLLSEIDVTGGVRLLGVGVSGLSDWVQDDLFGTEPEAAEDPGERSAGGFVGVRTDGASGEDAPADAVPSDGDRAGDVRVGELLHETQAWVPGMDVVHDEHGPGWVWGSGLGRVTVRFETAGTPPGPVRTFAADDPALSPARPHPQALSE